MSTVLTLTAIGTPQPAIAGGFIEFFYESAKPWLHRWRAWRADLSLTHRIDIPVPGKTPLQASLALPAREPDQKRQLGTVLVMLPYGRTEYGEALRAVIEFGRAGFAVVTMDLRGYETDKPDNLPAERMIPWQGVGRDAGAALDWISRQPWSNGKVGTFGCSALGETQFALAREKHPAHAAMLVSGAGGALGRIGRHAGYFGLFEGGIFQLASGYGWLGKRGWLQPPYVRAPFANPDTPLTELSALPVTNMITSPDNAWRFITGTPLDDPSWQAMGYLMQRDTITMPLLTINTWADQTVGEAIVLHEHAGSPHKRLILGPGDHCNHEMTTAPDTGNPSGHGWQAVYNDWFRRWLATDAKDRPDTEQPPVLFRAPGDSQWQSAGQWPPATAEQQTLLLSATAGNDKLARRQPQSDAQAAMQPDFSRWIADPARPVPSLGGPVCCTSTPVIRSGPVDQRAIESRDDLLVFTSAPFDAATRYAGPVSARLYFSSSAVDAVLVVRLTRVSPTGESINIQEGAQRVSLRDGPATRRWLTPGRIVPVDVTVRPIAHVFAPGHRLRVHVAASSFPRLARNLQSGGFNRSMSRPTVATHTLHHSGAYPSQIILTRLPQ